jgi:DNA primase
MTITTSQQIHQWLIRRNITPKVIESSKLFWNGTHIEIPIFDITGKRLYHKYRKDPFSNDDSPKYKYDAGGMSTLYNAHTIRGLQDQTIFITEGELDCLVLNSFGFFAVSSTSGSATFKPEWAEILRGNKIYIVYDRDDAGLRGALKVNKMVDWAKIILLPKDTQGKDVTDYFKTHTVKEFIELVEKAETWTLPHDPINIPQNKAGIDAILKELRQHDEVLRDRIREATSLNQETKHMNMLVEMLTNRLEYWQKQRQILNKPTYTYNNDSNDVEQAKKVPINKFVKMNYSNFACCLWHKEKSPSMKWYADSNKLYCFGCNVHKDVIDVVMQQNSVDFKEAIKIILNKN